MRSDMIMRDAECHLPAHARRLNIESALSIVLVIAMVPAWWFSGYFGKEVLSEIAIFAMLAMSLHVLVGGLGLVSLGHASFFALGAYGYAGTSVLLGWPPIVALLFAVVATATMACLIGFFVVRLGGVFFIMITLAVGQMTYLFFLKSRAFNADDGLARVPRLDLSFIYLDASSPVVFSGVALAVTAVVLVFLLRVVHSPFGHTLMAMRQNEKRLRALGCPVFIYKLVAFTLAGGIAGLAGVIGAQHLSFVSPDIAYWTVSGEILIMVVVGGLSSLPGAALGAVVVVLLRHYLSALSDYWGLVMGLFFIGIVLFASDGVAGRLSVLCEKLSTVHKRLSKWQRH